MRLYLLVKQSYKASGFLVTHLLENTEYRTNMKHRYRGTCYTLSWNCVANMKKREYKQQQLCVNVVLDNISLY